MTGHIDKFNINLKSGYPSNRNFRMSKNSAF